MYKRQDDDPAGALESAAQAVQIWAVPGFEIVHLYEMLAQAEVHLYTNDPEQASALLQRSARPLRRSMMWTLHHVAHKLEYIKARILLQQSLKAGSVPGRRLKAHLRKLERSPHDFARANGTLLRACLLRQTAGDDTAQLRYREAAAAFKRLGMVHLFHTARAGVLSCSGEPLDEALEALEALGARNPAAWINCFAPGALAHPSLETH